MNGKNYLNSQNGLRNWVKLLGLLQNVDLENK
jgi:hypothetical protein